MTTRPSDLHAALARAAADIDHMRDRLDRALAELRRAQPGIRSVPTDSTGGPSVGDAVHDAAMARSHDPAVRALADLVDWVRAAEERTRSARIIVDVWAAQASTAGAGHGDPGCQWMAAHNGPWEEARYVALGPDGTRMRVGANTWSWLRATGALPPPHIVRAWARGERPRRPTRPST